MSKSYFYSAGKRKTAVARVKILPEGKGDAVINDLAITDYFSGTQIENAVAPLRITGLQQSFNVQAFVAGGGKSAQSDAVRHGISRALLLFNPELRGDLKRAGFLGRDSRIKERKKPGLKRARRAPQWQKR